MTLKYTVATGLVAGVRASTTPAGRGSLDDLARGVDARGHEILTAIVLDDAARAGPVLDRLVRDDAHPGFGDGVGGEAFGLGIGRVGHRRHDGRVTAAWS